MSDFDVTALIGTAVVDRSGERIGDVAQVYLDDATGRPKWVTVRTGRTETFVPLSLARGDGGRLVLDASAEEVSRAPRAGGDGHLSAQEETAIHRYYGFVDRTDDDDAMTRSEERLVPRAPEVQATRARLRKYVVTETVTVEVPVRREEVRLEHEPLPAVGGAVTDVKDVTDATDEQVEMILHAERPVVTVETVPVERVRLDKETVTGTETVTGQVRKEQIELDDPTR